MGGWALAQPHSPVPPPDVGSKTLPQSLAAGVNYYSLVPVRHGVSDLHIDNLAQHANDVLLVGENERGQRETQVLNIKQEDSHIIEKGDLSQFDHVYLISMQPFHVQAKDPIMVFGMRTRHFTTVTPTRSLELVEVENEIGRKFIVGVTPDGDVHYPAYGFKFGTIDRMSRIITHKNGLEYDMMER